jgi:hypothetical protein
MSKLFSSYYPPRARWYGRIFYFGIALRQLLALDRIRLPEAMAFRELAGGFFIPGLTVYLRGPRRWGRAAMAGCALLFLVFIVGLGYPAANVAFGLMLSIHTTGLVYYCSPWLIHEPLCSRIFLTIGMMLALGLFFYVPLRSTIQNHCLMPLRMGDRVMVILVGTKPELLKRGDWAAFRSSPNGGGEAGFVLGPVMGLGGDRVGSLEVPENHWLMQAEFARYYSHEPFGFFAALAAQGGIVQQMVIVSREDYVGRPFKRWFFRKQILP